MDCICGRIIEGNPSDHICGTGKLTREARKLQRRMKEIQEKLLDSHSVEERNALLAPETKKWTEQYPVVCWDCRPDLWVGKNVIFAPVTAMYCCECKKYMDPLDQPRKSIDDFDWDKYYKEKHTEAHAGYEHDMKFPFVKSWKFEKEPSTFDGENYVTGGYDPSEEIRAIIQKEIDKKNQEIENLLGHIRRLEKSNQELGEKLHRTTEGVGWNKNPK